MSSSPTDQRSDSLNPGRQAMGQQLLADDAMGGAVILRGISGAHFERELPQLRETMAEHGRLVFCLDPTGTASSAVKLLDIVQIYVGEVSRRGLLGVEAQQLFEFIAVSIDELEIGGQSWRQLSSDALSRLWANLSQAMPAILFVVHPHRCPVEDLEQLHHLMRYFFADPIQALTPEVASWEQAAGSLVLVEGSHDIPSPLRALPATVIDVSDTAEEAVREFLASSDVIRRFVSSTGGDLQRLDELVESLPGDVQQFWMYRYAKLDASQARLLDVLSVAGGPLTVDRLHKAMELLECAEYFSRCLRLLIDGGFVRRGVGHGMMVLSIEDVDFAALVRDRIEAQESQRIHLVLARAELACQPDQPSTSFLAAHFLAGGEVDSGVHYGMQAARQMCQRREFEGAAELLDEVLRFATSPEDVHEIHDSMVEVCTALGNHRKALAHCGNLKRFVTTRWERMTLLSRTAYLLNRIGHCETAVRLFSSALELASHDESDAADPLRVVDALIGRGEALYSLGRHAEASEACEEVLRALECAREGKGGDASTNDAVLIRARNLLGKIAIFQAQYQRAIALFTDNNVLASRWGWERESARALANLGVVELQQRHYAEAHKRLERALQMVNTPGSLPRAYCLLNIAIVHQRQAQYAEALSHYLESLRASKKSGDSVAYSICAHNLATLYQDMGAHERAIAMVEHLEQEGQGARHAFIGRWTQLLRGQVFLEQESLDEAVSVFSSMPLDGDDLRGVVYGTEAALRLVEALIGLERWADAQSALAKFRFAPEGNDEPQLGSLRDLCEAAIAAHAGDFERSKALAGACGDDLKKLGQTRDALRARLVLAESLIGLGHNAEACTLLEQDLLGLRERAKHVPEEFRARFYAIALHQRLVARVQQLNGDVPEEFAKASQSMAVGQAASVDEPAAKRARVVDPAFVKWRRRYHRIVGEDARLHQIFRFIDRVAASTTTVLINGESGTGKELVAEAIHEHSKRDDKPFIKVNCAAFVESLLLSELFGHEKGAFTGAMGQKIGRFELAAGGTLFIDEIGDISPNTQVALLRVLQEGTFERVGGTQTQTVDVRVICATNKNLEEMVKRGEFRLDLYYRLKGLVMEMPPLRERRQDIPVLAAHFAAKYAGTAAPKRFSREVLQFLSSYSWSGNIRELENFVKSVLLFVEGATVEMEHIQDFGDFFAADQIDLELPEIDCDVCLPDYEDVVIEAVEDPEEALVEQIVADGLSLTKLKKRLELECIKRALSETDGNITRAADLLQMKRPRLSQIINATPELLEHKEQLVS